VTFLPHPFFVSPERGTKKTGIKIKFNPFFVSPERGAKKTGIKSH
jgi:hypothetical protein